MHSLRTIVNKERERRQEDAAIQRNVELYRKQELQFAAAAREQFEKIQAQKA
jgi:hypothetical protein